MSHRVRGFAVPLPVASGALALVVACRPAAEPAATPEADRVPAQPAVAVPGIDFAGIDRAVLPGDDFFGFANGGWAKRTDIPPDRADWGIGAELSEATNLRLKALLESAGQSAASGSEPRKVADFYATFMDEASIEAQGIAPLELELGRLAAIQDRVQLARELGRSLRADVDPLNNTNFHTDRLFGLWVSPALAAPGRNQAYLLQGGLGLPDRDHYVEDGPRMAEIRAQYLSHITKILDLAGIPGATGKAARVLALETKMAKVHLSREASTDVLRANNSWAQDEFSKRAPGLDWRAFFAAARLERARVITVWQPTAIAGLAALSAAEPLSDWKDWLAFHAIDRRSPLLGKAFVEEDFSFYHRALYGTPQMRERWKRGVALTNEALGDAVGQLYVARYFPPASKAALQAMVRDIVMAFGKRIDRLEWMAPSTRAVAKRKLATLYVGIGYPDHWIDYAPLEVVRGDAVGNAERAELFLYRRSLAKLDAPVDKTEWWMVAQIVNALNLPLQNALNFPAAILVPPFFDPAAPAAVNYGSIGSTIGHEISHSFDDQGAQFDPDGKLTDWWTKADREHFEASGAQLVAQYDAYRPFADLHVNGKLTLGENIADLAGLAAAHDAWLASLDGQPAPVLGGLTGEQQFFLAYAQGWRSKQREPSLRQQLITDGHAPDEYRANTVRNIDGWYTAFDVTPSQALYLPPEQRVNVW